MRTLAERKALLGMLAWVKVLKEPVPCDGVKWSTVALRDTFSMHGKPARGIQERSRCKNRAHWRYTALESSHARSGNFCYAHLVDQVNAEYDRFERYVTRYLTEEK